MDRVRIDRNNTISCGNYNNVNEPEYDEVEVLDNNQGVCILPALPINEEREYADRDRSSFSSLSSVGKPPKCPPRETLHTEGPPVNRNLKPGRKKTKLDRRLPPLPPDVRHSQRSSSSPSTFTFEMVNAFAALSEHQTHGNERLRTPEEEDAAFHVRGQHPADCASAHPLNKRHSWDLETHDLDKRSNERLERVPSRRLHHEWPQTKEDIEQHEFCPVKRSQINCEEGWYIGACKRIDAEHALHLVNKNGAFLVRDCSNSSDSEPLVLVVFHDKKVYNVKIRFIESTGKYALGTGLQSNEMFDSVGDIIKFHSLFPIILISGRNISGIKYPDNCVLTCPISKGDVELLLQ